MCLTTEDHTHHFNNNFQFSEGWPFPNSPKGGHDCLKLSSLLHTSVVYTDIAIHTHQATHCMRELTKLTAHAGLVFCECDWTLMLLFWDIPSIFLVLLTSKYSIACDRNNKFMTDFPFEICKICHCDLWKDTFTKKGTSEYIQHEITPDRGQAAQKPDNPAKSLMYGPLKFSAICLE